MVNPGTIMLGGIFGILVNYALRDFFHVAVARDTAFQAAINLSNGKGIVNIGCGPHHTYLSKIVADHPAVLANLDIAPDGMPNFIQIDLERSPLPFADKQFGCAFASHVLEHLDNWSFALEEACRVAENVVVVLPDPLYVSGWLWPSHIQHFSRTDIREMVDRYPNVEVYI